MNAAAEELGVPIVRFEEDITEASNPAGRFYRSFEVARAVLDADVVVNIPKLKTHGLTLFTGAVKNVFFVKDGAVITPKRRNVLPGSTRNSVIEVARGLDLPLLRPTDPLTPRSYEQRDSTRHRPW